ncbi:hypothetical protein [Paenibacillus sp. PDC88]|uniref:hypothetical protein n=1 Tax=Paenibacillus sp. PDC88 TaxID=1884375 RepID=UPI000895EE6E|nr:hypothetical protein [Paenibacillus sp. PDC88]SDW23109.1 hypothetical protein SAMN05518848_101730 [Paenibacillus sp. PDC88]
MIDLDRFKPPDEPEIIVSWCAYCGVEIYEGSEMTTYSNGDKTHDGHCENEYVKAELGIERVIASGYSQMSTFE